MELQQLRGFLAVAKTRSFTTAARQTRRTQPTVTLQIQSLEQELGVKLFKRANKNKMALTNEGEILQKLASPLIHDFDSLQARFEENCGVTNVSSVSIMTHQSIMMYFLPDIIKDFKKLYPDCRLHILAASSRKEIAEKVSNGDIDFGVTSLTVIPENLTYHRFSRFNRILIAKKDHPLAKKKRITLQDIASFPLILPAKGSNTRTIIDSCFEENGLDYSLSMEVSGRQAIKSYVGMNLGISIMNEYYVKKEDRKKLYLKDMSHYFGKAETGLLIRNDFPLSLPAQALVKLIRNTSKTQ